MDRVPSDEPFSFFASLVLKLQSQPKSKEKFMLLERALSVFPSSADLYPLLRLLFPAADVERGVYGMKEGVLARLFSDIIGLPPQEKDRLLGWKNPQKVGSMGGVVVGDFASVLGGVLRSRICAEPENPPTIGLANSTLSELAAASSSELKKSVLSRILQYFPNDHVVLLIRVILSTVGIGMGVGSVLKKLHPEGETLYNQTSSIKSVTDLLLREHKGESTLREPSLLFSVIKPMLAKRLYPADIEEAFKQGNDLLLEPKLDGERLIAHIDRSEEIRISLFTRNGKDMTSKYKPGLKLENCLRGRSAVLDGELLSVDKNGKILPFGRNKTVADDFSEDHLSFRIFDVIYYADNSGTEFDLRSTPLTERKELLEKIVIKNDSVEIVSYQSVRNAQQVADELRKATEKGEEGVMVKEKKSLYVLGARSAGWWKLKPDYDGVLSDTVDLVVIGGYYGSRTSNQAFTAPLLNAFLLASIDEHGNWKTVGKVGTGFSQNQLEEISQIFAKHSCRKLPVDLRMRKSDLPDLFLNPTISLVLEIKAAQIVPSDSYSGQLTLRFPRCIGIRKDKNNEDCTQLKELKDMLGRGLQKNNRSDSDVETPPPKKRKESTPKTSLVLGADLLNKQPSQSGLLTGITVFVANGANLLALAKELGACLTAQYIPNKTRYVMAEKDDQRVKNVATHAKVDVLNQSFLEACRDTQSIVQVNETHILRKAA